MKRALLVAVVISSVLGVIVDSDVALAAEPEECLGLPSTPIHPDATISGQMLADVDGDGSRDLLTGYSRTGAGLVEEWYLHVEFTSGWATGVRLDTIPQLDANRSYPIRVVVVAGERLILNGTASIAPGLAYSLFRFDGCALAPVPLVGGGYPDLWSGIGPSHSEWPTCRGDEVAQVEVGKSNANSVDYDAATERPFRLTPAGFVDQGEQGLAGARTLAEWLGVRPDCTSPSGSFVDDEGSRFGAAIEWAAIEEITLGCNPPVNDRFCPDDPVTRGQMAAFLVRAMDYSDDGGGDLFTDDDGSIFESAIDRLKTAGVTLGCNPPVNDRFCPDRRLTRGEMAALVVRAMGYSDDGGGDLFTDDDGSIFESAIDRLKTAGVTLGCNPPVNDHFCPDNFVTREQMAAFLRRAVG
jgi:hypothetical protein